MRCGYGPEGDADAPARRPAGARRWAASVLLVFGLAAAAAAGDVVRVLTEDLPPYSVVHEGRVEGASTEVVRAVLEQAALDYRIEVMPWVDAYTSARLKADLLLYSVARNDTREAHFHWIGEIAPLESCFYRLSSDDHISISSLEDARAYRVGAAAGSWGAQLLSERGYRYDRELVISQTEHVLMAALARKTIDLWFAPRPNVEYRLQHDPDSAALSATAAYCIRHEQGLYLVASLGTAPARVEALRQALQALQRSGRIEEILARHGLG